MASSGCSTTALLDVKFWLPLAQSKEDGDGSAEGLCFWIMLLNGAALCRHCAYETSTLVLPGGSSSVVSAFSPIFSPLYPLFGDKSVPFPTPLPAGTNSTGSMVEQEQCWDTSSQQER